MRRRLEVAAQLAEQRVTTADLDELRGFLSQNECCVPLQYFARYLRSARAAETIVIATARIFDLIGAVKDYSNMDRSPILEVDVPAGLDATLQMFGSRMTNIEVERQYQPDLPRISAYSGELNQVWTALIEMHWTQWATKVAFLWLAGLRADMLLVEIWDNGPGIAPELQERIFEPFLYHQAPVPGLVLASTTRCASCASIAAI
ncbi:MAG: hypothetical protein WDM87_08175 [Terracidiphilus sp.]